MVEYHKSASPDTPSPASCWLALHCNTESRTQYLQTQKSPHEAGFFAKTKQKNYFSFISL
jgi:hypothetical protein